METKRRKTALITGATSGIGAAYARWFAQHGYDLIITGRRAEKIQAIADELSDKNHVDVDVILIELSHQDEVEAFIAGIQDREIEVLVNNAGFGTKHYFHREALHIQEEMVAVHILCAMKLTYAILPGMLQKNKGIIINVSSTGAFMSTPRQATYVGTKAFLRAFSEALYYELIGTGVKVQAVCPGLTKTDMPIRLGIPEDQMVAQGPVRWITPEEVVEASMKCLHKNRVICIPDGITRFQMYIRNLLPSFIYNKLIINYFKKYGWTEE